ncbi:hypothetical protein HMI55_006806 [Coelomomyces lativittatus]|nr:hypothetical protein HMI55_006806 [Coelomomyces lativittatus]
MDLPLPFETSFKETSILFDAYRYRSFGPYSISLPKCDVNISQLNSLFHSSMNLAMTQVYELNHGHVTSNVFFHENQLVHGCLLQYQPNCQVDQWPYFLGFPSPHLPYQPKFKSHHPLSSSSCSNYSSSSSSGSQASLLSPFDPSIPLDHYGTFYLLLHPAENKRILLHFPHHFVHLVNASSSSKHTIELVFLSSDATFCAAQLHFSDTSVHVYHCMEKGIGFFEHTDSIAHVIPYKEDLAFIQTCDHQVVPIQYNVEWKCINTQIHCGEITYQQKSLSSPWISTFQKFWKPKKSLLQVTLVHLKSKTYLALLTASDVSFYSLDSPSYSQVTNFSIPETAQQICSFHSKLALYTSSTIYIYHVDEHFSIALLESVPLDALERNNRFVDFAFYDQHYLVVLKTTFSNYEVYVHPIVSEDVSMEVSLELDDGSTFSPVWFLLPSDSSIPSFVESLAYQSYARHVHGTDGSSHSLLYDLEEEKEKKNELNTNEKIHHGVWTHDRLVSSISKLQKKTMEEARNDVALYLVKYVGHVNQVEKFFRLSERTPLMLSKRGGMSLFRPYTDLERYLTIFQSTASTHSMPLYTTSPFSEQCLLAYKSLATMFQGFTLTDFQTWLQMDLQDLPFSLASKLSVLSESQLQQLEHLQHTLTTQSKIREHWVQDFKILFEAFAFDEASLSMHLDISLTFPSLICPFLHQVVQSAQQLAQILFLLYMSFGHFVTLPFHLNDLLPRLRTVAVLPYVLLPSHLSLFPSQEVIPLTQLDEWACMYLGKVCSLLHTWSSTDFVDYFFDTCTKYGHQAFLALVQHPYDRLYLQGVQHLYNQQQVGLAIPFIQLAAIQAPSATWVYRVASQLELHLHQMDLAIMVLETLATKGSPPSTERVDRLFHLYLRAHRLDLALPMIASTPRPALALAAWGAQTDVSHAKLPLHPVTCQALTHITSLEVRAAFYVYQCRDYLHAAQCYHGLPTNYWNLTRAWTCLKLASSPQMFVSLQGDCVVTLKDLEKNMDHHWMAYLVSVDSELSFGAVWEECLRLGHLHVAQHMWAKYPEEFKLFKHQEGTKLLKAILTQRAQHLS